MLIVPSSLSAGPEVELTQSGFEQWKPARAARTRMVLAEKSSRTQICRRPLPHAYLTIYDAAATGMFFVTAPR